MLVSMDRAGRVVIPKEIRDRLSIDADVELDIVLEGDSIRLMPRRGAKRQVVEIDGWSVLAPVAGVTTTDADIQSWRDADQR